MKRSPLLEAGDAISRSSPREPPAPSTQTVVPLPSFTPELFGRRLDLEILRSFPLGRQLVQAFVDWQGAKRGGYTVGLDVRRYARHVVTANAEFGLHSLQAYRDALGSDSRLADGTRRSYYSNAAAYVDVLAKRGLVPDEGRPAGFRGVRTLPKKTFAESAKNWERVKAAPIFSQWLGSVAQVPNLDKTEREVLAVSQGWMGLLEDEAERAVRQQIEDWEFADAAIRRHQASDEGQGWQQDRSIAAAIAHLHAMFGYVLPASPEWPSGIADYCKYRGWGADRLRAALFPTVKSLDAFLVLALANRELAPNVDSVLFYAFSGCVTPTEEASKFRVAFGKFRGSGADATFDRHHALVLGLQALDRVVTRTVGPQFASYSRLTRDGGLPLFLHACTRMRPAQVKVVDPSTSANMVRRFIRTAAGRDSTLSPLVEVVTGEQFRTTHLLTRSLRGESVFSVQRVAKHSDPGTTLGYLNRVEVEASNRIRHRDYQNYLITEARGRRAKRLGNGFHCAPESAKQEECVRLDACGAGEDGCPARRIVLESPKIVAEWLAWAAHIEGKSAYLQEHRPERWAAVWGPRLVEYRVLLESTSATARAEAQKHVAHVALLPLE